MRCIDRRWRIGMAGLSLMAGCSTAPPSSSVPSARPVVRADAGTSSAPAAPAAPARSAPAAPTRLAAPGPVRNWGELRRQAALRMVAANPNGTYVGEVPDTLLAIPVLEIELNGDGSIRRIDVLRQPREARDTLQLAIDAVRRAAPFGDVSRLPKPWRFAETFLFNDARRFKPRTLD